MVVTNRWQLEELHDGDTEWTVHGTYDSPVDAEWMQRSRWADFPLIKGSLIVVVRTEITHQVWGAGALTR